jgi:capsular exopolysaccharide synthesis family protein
MSRIFEALQQSNPELVDTIGAGTDSAKAVSPLVAALSGHSLSLDEAPRFTIPADPESRLVASTEPNSLAAESLRVLASRLRQAQQRRTIKKLVVTSAVRADGKSTISLNLALTLAAHGERTLLIDGDLHQPSLAKLLQVDGDRGFATWSETREPIRSLLHRAEDLPLWFLPSGTCHGQPLALIHSNETAELLDQLGTWFSWVVIDSPPLVPLADANIWATMANAVLLLVRQGVTPKEALLKSVESLDKSKLFGVIMNGATATGERYYREYYSRNVSAARAASPNKS